MATNISSFREKVLPYVPGCPIPAVDVAVVDSMQQFCTETNAFTKTIGATGSAPDENFPYVFPFTFGENDTGDFYIASISLTDYTAIDDYDPIIPTYYAEDGNENWALQYMELDNEVNNLEDIRPNYVRFYRFSSVNTMKIFPFSTSGEGEVDMTITISLKPEDGVTSVDDKFFNEWREPIIRLTASKIQAQPKRAWTDLEQAQINLGLYNSMKSSVNFSRDTRFKKKRYSKGYI